MLSDALENLFSDEVSEILTVLLMILLVLLVTWLVRQVVSALLPRLIKTLTQRTHTRLDDYLNRIVAILQPPLRFAITVFGLWIAVILVEPPDGVQSAVNRVMASLVAFAIFWTFYRSVDLVVSVMWQVSRRTMDEIPVTSLLDERLEQVTRELLKALIVIFGVTVVMEEWGYSISGLVAGLGIGGLAVALAAQDALANLFGYFVILADEPFVPNEYIVVEGVAGTVEGIGFRSTRIRVLDQSLVTVPNKTIMNANVTNWSRLSKRRLNMTLGLEYRNSPEQVLSVVQAIREMLSTHELVQEDSITVQFVEFNASSLDIMIICFMKTPAWGDFQAARQDINLKIMHILAERGVGVAFPTRTIMVEPAAPGDDVAPKMVPPPAPEPTGGTATDSPVPDDAAN